MQRPVTQPLDDETLRQPLHEQQRQPAQHAHDGQQHLVEVPTADDEREMQTGECEQPARQR